MISLHIDRQLTYTRLTYVQKTRQTYLHVNTYLHTSLQLMYEANSIRYPFNELPPSGFCQQVFCYYLFYGVYTSETQLPEK